MTCFGRYDLRRQVRCDARRTCTRQRLATLILLYMVLAPSDSPDSLRQFWCLLWESALMVNSSLSLTVIGDADEYLNAMDALDATIAMAQNAAIGIDNEHPYLLPPRLAIEAPFHLNEEEDFQNTPFEFEEELEEEADATIPAVQHIPEVNDVPIPRLVLSSRRPVESVTSSGGERLCGKRQRATEDDGEFRDAKEAGMFDNPEDSHLWEYTDWEHDDLNPHDCAVDSSMEHDDDDVPHGVAGSEKAVAAHFVAMGQSERLSQPKKRLNGKQTISRPPGQKLGHYARARGISALSLWLMMISGLPLVLINALAFVEATSSHDRVHCSEYFSGEEMVAGAFRNGNYKAAVFDIRRHKVMESMLTAEGLLSALSMAHQTLPYGLDHWATACSSWIFLARASSGRSLAQPLGRTSIKWVREANTMAARVSLLMVVCMCLFQTTIHEQPQTSLLHRTPFFRWMQQVIADKLFHWHEFVRVHIWMGAYGHQTKKGTELVASNQFALALKKPIAPIDQLAFASSLTSTSLPHDPATMRRRVMGASGLKQTQVYPAAYGAAVFDLWKQFYATADMDAIRDDDLDEADVPWDDWLVAAPRANFHEADLDSLAAMLNVPADRLV